MLACAPALTVAWEVAPAGEDGAYVHAAIVAAAAEPILDVAAPAWDDAAPAEALEASAVDDGETRKTAEAPEPAAAPARPRPVREYAVPAPVRSGGWPFGPNVYRWQPLVEQELKTLRGQRRLDGGITSELVLAVIAAESLGDPEALSESDAVGLMQLLPSTFADLVEGDPFDPALNVRAGILYLNLALGREDGDVEWAVAAYHAGIGAASRARSGSGDLYDSTLDYVETVLAYRDRAITLRGSAPPVPPLVLSVREKLRPAEMQTQLIAATVPAAELAEIDPAAAEAHAPQAVSAMASAEAAEGASAAAGGASAEAANTPPAVAQEAGAGAGGTLPALVARRGER